MFPQFLLSWYGGIILPHTPDLWSFGCKLRVSWSSWATCWHFGIVGGLGDSGWDQLGYWGEGLQCHLNLSLPLEWECLLNPDDPAGVSSFSYLATSIPQGPAEGKQAHEMEWLQECPQPLKEGLADLVLLCRPALAMHLASSWHSFLMHLSCFLQGSILGPTACSPCKLVLPPSGSLHQGTLKGSSRRSV